MIQNGRSVCQPHGLGPLGRGRPADAASSMSVAVATGRQEYSVIGPAPRDRACPHGSVPVLGIDSDNDSVFINETLAGYCEENEIELTRSRAYRKND